MPVFKTINRLTYYYFVCLKGSDTNATTECFCLLLLAIHQDIQVGTTGGVTRYTTRAAVWQHNLFT